MHDNEYLNRLQIRTRQDRIRELARPRPRHTTNDAGWRRVLRRTAPVPPSAARS